MQHDDDPEKLNSVNELNGKHGFVIAPFMPSEECPILLMRPDVVKHFPIQAVTTNNKKIHFPESVSEKEAYQKDFEDFHQQLTKGIFDKIVLARCSHQKSPEAKGLKAEELFKKACQMYPPSLSRSSPRLNRAHGSWLRRKYCSVETDANSRLWPWLEHMPEKKQTGRRRNRKNSST